MCTVGLRPGFWPAGPVHRVYSHALAMCASTHATRQFRTIVGHRRRRRYVRTTRGDRGHRPVAPREVLGILRDRIIPGLKEIDGFAGFISLVDEEKHRARNVVLFETKEAAEEAERKFGPIREETVRGMGGGNCPFCGALRGTSRGPCGRTRLLVGKRCGPFAARISTGSGLEGRSDDEGLGSVQARRGLRPSSNARRSL